VAARNLEAPIDTQGSGEPSGVAPAVEVDDVVVTFERDRREVLALDGVGFEVPDGGFLSLLGPSGSGKSTLLRVIADLVTPVHGAARVNGRSARESREARSLGFVFQDAALLPWRTALDNVLLPLELGGHGKGVVGPSAEELLDMVGLGDRMDAYPRELSGGMRQRVAIARALVTRPNVLLMDEPFGALDEITRERLNEELLRIWEETKTTVLFVTHSIPEAVFLSQRVAVLTAQPGRLAGMVEIDLPYPRRRQVRETPEFARLASTVRSILERHG
jgi:NitT/TauT family transport system ATP-binding protein